MFIQRLILTALLCASLACREKQPEPVAPAARTPLNVVLISVDTLRADALGIYGNRTVMTPNMDGLGKNGAVFRRHLSHTPLTLPSHATMLTGLLPAGHGIHDNNGYRLTEKPAAIAEQFRQRGYATAAFVSSTVLDHRFGLERGFDVYEDRFRFARGKYERRSEEPAAATADKAVRWLQANPRSPFFLFVHFYDPHAPYHPPDGYAERNGSDYLGEVACVDEQIGLILGTLEPVRRNTLIALTSDHGEGLGDHDELGHGLFLYDSTLRVPLILNGPSVKTREIQAQTGIADIMPSLLELAEIPVPPGLDGRSLVPLIRGEAMSERPILSETLYPLQVGWSPLFASSASGLKHIDAPRPELYDLRTDPGELKNVFSQQQATIQAMIQKTKSYRKAALAGRKQAVADPELEEQLRSLGYLSGSSSNLNPDSLPDPKDRLEVWKLFERSTYLSMEGQNAEAVQALEQALKLEPRNAVLYDTMGRYLFETSPEKAAGMWRRALELDPQNHTYHHKLAECYEKSGKVELALQEEQLALKINPEMLEALLGAAETLIRTGRHGEAAGYLDRALRIDPRNASALYQSGVAWRMAGNPVRAVDFYEKAIAASPDLPLAYYEAGILKGQMGDLQGAEALMRGAVQADPGFAEAHYNLGVLYERMGRTGDASREYSRFLELADRQRLADRIATAQKRLDELNR